MSKVKLTSYLNRIEAKYIKAREEWEKIQEQLNQEEERFNNIKWMNYSAQGVREEKEKHSACKNKLLMELEKVRSDFSESVEEIKKDSDKLFNRVFQYTASDIDQNGVTILQNSTMSSSELMNFAESYREKGNYTMYFMIAEKMKSDKPDIEMTEDDKKARAYYEKALARRQTREDHELIEAYKEVCLKMLRDERYLADGIHKIHDDFYNGYKEEAEKIETETVSPWEN